MQLTPLIAIHMTAALAAVAIGPLALWARRGHASHQSRSQRPRLHRAAGYAWVTLMLITAFSAIFISDPTLPNIAGFSAIHLLIPIVLGMLFLAFRQLLRGNVDTRLRRLEEGALDAILLACAGLERRGRGARHRDRFRAELRVSLHLHPPALQARKHG